MANQPRKIGPRPQAGHFSRSARHTNDSIGWERLSSPLLAGATNFGSLGGDSMAVVIVAKSRYVDHCRLSECIANVNVHAMVSIARLLQMIGLTIPVLAVIAQLASTIDARQMLGFLVASVLIFSIGYLLQRYGGGGPA
jgi:hypothetical protein